MLQIGTLARRLAECLGQTMDLLGQAIDHDTAAENEKTAGKQSDVATVPAKIFHHGNA